MSVVANIISAVMKSVVGDKIGNELVNEVIGISLDEISEKGINKINDFINEEKSIIEHVLSNENLQSMNIPEDHIDYLVAEIKDLLLEVEITDEVLRQCKYDSMNLSAFLWNKYGTYKNIDIEYGSDVKRGLFAISEAIISLVRKSEVFQQELLIQINSSVDDVNAEIQEISIFLKKNFNELDENNQRILDTLRMLLKQTQNLNLHDENAQIINKSRTHEYADKWISNMFLNDFDMRDETSGVNVKLRDVYLRSHLPHYKWKKNYMESSDLDGLLSEYIENNKENKMLLILGQPGIGKSTLITWITANFIANIDKILVYQFASDLSEIGWENVDDNYNIVNEILEKLSLKYDDLNEKILIIDGFDEISIKSEREKILNRLYRDLIENDSIYNFSLIITCRENYIQNLDELKCNYITLQPWDSTQIQSFCRAYQKKTQIKISKRIIEIMLEAQNFLGIPLILYMILALEISIDEDGGIVDIYDQIFSLDGGIYDRCIEKGRYEKSHRIAVIKKQIHQLSRDIALWMFENNHDQAYIPKEEYKKLCDHIVKEQKQENQDVEWDFLIGNFFRLTKHYDGCESEEIYFVHRSIYEYFVVEYIFDSMQTAISISKEKLADVYGFFLKGNILSINMLDFLQRKIEKSVLNQKFDMVDETFQLMINDGMTYYTHKCFKNVIMCEMNVFYNMLELMHLWRGKRFKFNNSITKYLNWGLTFKFNLTNTDLVGVDLSGVNLSNVSLLGVNILGEV